MKKRNLLLIVVMCLLLAGCSVDYSSYNDYVKGALDARYFDDYTNVTAYETVKALDHEFHEEAIDHVYDYILEKAMLEKDEISDELQDKYKLAINDLLSKVQIVSSKVILKGTTPYVQIKVKPIVMDHFKQNITDEQDRHFDTLVAWHTVSKQKGEVLDMIYTAKILDHLIDLDTNIKYGKAKTYSFKVVQNNGEYTISQEDLQQLDLNVLGFE